MLAAIFVPVLFHFVLAVYIVPSAWGVLAAFHCLLLRANGNIIVALILLFHVAVYLGIFYALARLTDWFAVVIYRRSLRLAFRGAILCGVFLCSFIPTLTYSSICSKGGTYTFWTAAERYSETRKVW